MTDWYKMTPLDWNKGTEKLTLEQESAYLRLCHAMYIQGGPISDNPFVLAGYFRSDTKKARRLLKELVEAGKVTVEDGEISNKRAMDVISSRDHLSMVRQTSAKRSRNVSETFSEQSKNHSETDDDKSLKNNNTSLANANGSDVLDKIREDKIREDKEKTEFHSVQKKPKKTGCRMPDDFFPDIEYAIKEGLTRGQAEQQSEAMRDWSKSSKNGVKHDWPATWRNWVRSFRERVPEQGKQKNVFNVLEREIENDRKQSLGYSATIDHETELSPDTKAVVHFLAPAQRY